MRFNSTEPENLTWLPSIMKDRLMTFPDIEEASAWPTKAGPVRASVNSDNSARPWFSFARILPKEGTAQWEDRRRQGGGRTGRC